MTALIQRPPAQGAGIRLARYAAVAARIALGLVFTLAGASIVFFIANPPPMQPGLAGSFTAVFFQSRWVIFVDGAELFAGILLLANRFVPFALVILAALLFNILAFHLTMQPQTIALPICLTALWFVLAYQQRAILMQLFA